MTLATRTIDVLSWLRQNSDRCLPRRLHQIGVLVLLLIATHSSSDYAQPLDRWAERREAMVSEHLVSAGIQNDRVLQAIRTVPRHLFVPRQLRNQAYFDMALPIGEQQTISSPFIVAFMTECLDPQPSDRVLEIGTGSGYQAAVLSHLVEQVYTIEIVPQLGTQARRTLHAAQCNNVTVKIGDGFQGWEEHAPFNKIIVTCSPEDIPQPLIDQLRDGGLMVIPVGERYQQTMYLLRKKEGKLEREALRPTLFVPMTGKAESNRDVLPDPNEPELVNSSFEEVDPNTDFVPGWYYQRQAEQVADEEAPDGKHYVRFQNKVPGQDAHLLQGLAIDGRNVPRIELSGWVKTEGVDQRLRGPEGPRIVVSFYDDERRDLGQRWLGPWRGETPWHRVKQDVPVPGNAREMIVRIGLFGATGTASFDHIEVKRSPIATP